MLPQTHLVKINLPGGIVPAGDLLTILEVAERAEVVHVQFGHRQQLLCRRWPRPVFHAKLMLTGTPTSQVPTW
jgi:hypothetical protein